MSANRRHTDVIELGWLDFLAASATKVIRVQGRRYSSELPGSDGRMKRFNQTFRLMDDHEISPAGPSVHAMRVRRSRSTGEWVDVAETTLEWKSVDWISFKPTGDPNGTWLKVTVQDHSRFGEYDLFETRLIGPDGRVQTFDDRAEALRAAFAVVNG